MPDLIIVARPNTVGGVVAPAELGTGTPNSSVYLRGDSAWVTPPSGAGANTLYAPGSVTIADGNFWIQCKRLQLTTTQRLSIAGTGRFRGLN